MEQRSIFERTRTRAWLAAGTLALAGIQAMAHEQPPAYDRISLSVDAGEEVENDVLVIVLFTEEQETSQTKAAAHVNKAMTWALARAARAEGVRAQTLGYRTNPVYRGQSLTGWRVRQALRLEGRDFDRVSELVGELQDRLAIESVSYSISPDARAAAEERLIARALERFQTRATGIAGGLGRSDYRVVQLDVNTQLAGPPPRLARAAMMATEAVSSGPPALEGGVQRVTVVVSGTIELQL